MTDAVVEHLLNVEHRKLFRERMKHWQERLGLHGWRVEPSLKKTTAMAQVTFTDDAKLASYRIGNNWKSTEPTPEAIDATAFHESVHILLRRVLTCAEAYGVGHADTTAAEHEVINTLEKLIVKQ